MTEKVEQLIAVLPQKMLRPLLIVLATGFCSLVMLMGAWGYTWVGSHEDRENSLAQELKSTREQVSGLTAAVNQLAQTEKERADELRDYRKEMRDFRQQLLDAVKAKR